MWLLANFFLSHQMYNFFTKIDNSLQNREFPHKNEKCLRSVWNFSTDIVRGVPRKISGLPPGVLSEYIDFFFESRQISLEHSSSVSSVLLVQKNVFDLIEPL